MLAALITTFSLSLVGMVYMLVRKMYLIAERQNRTTGADAVVVQNASVRAAMHYRRGQQVVVQYTLLGYRRVLRALAGLLRFVARFFIVLNTRVQRQLVSVTDMIKGRSRGNLASRDASLYLKDIARHKDEVRGNTERE